MPFIFTRCVKIVESGLVSAGVPVLLDFADTESIFAMPVVSVIVDSVSTTFSCDYPAFLRRFV